MTGQPVIDTRMAIAETKLKNLEDVPRRLNYIDRDVTENRADTRALVDKVGLLTKLVLLVLTINVAGILTCIFYIIGGK